MSALWTSNEVAQALGTAIAAPFEANGVTFDSRAVGKGDLFFALKGETTDGHGFVPEAMKSGAAAAVVSRDVENASGTLIRVPDTMKALEGLGRGTSLHRFGDEAVAVGKGDLFFALKGETTDGAAVEGDAIGFERRGDGRAERLRHFIGGPQRAHDTASANSRATSASSK